MYLRCNACAFLFVIDDRRSDVRTEHQRRNFTSSAGIDALWEPVIAPASDTEQG